MSISAVPLVSLIVPCYNASAYLRESIDSLLAQTYRNLEIIIIDDGSKDSTPEIIKSYSDDRIRYFFQENSGQSAASNLGIRNSAGEYIKFFDADDVMNPGHIELQLERLRGHEMSVASCEWGRFYDGNPASAIFTREPVWQDMNPLSWLRTSLRQRHDMMGGWLWLIPRPLLEKSGGWDERLSLNNDFEFSIRLLLNAEEVLFAEGAKVFYRSGMTTTLSQTFSRERILAALLSTDLGCGYLLEADSSADMRLVCANRYQEWLYRTYPDFPDLQRRMENRIKDLGGSDKKIDGGKIFEILSGTLGWKTTKRLKRYMGQFGYKKLPFH